MEQMRQQIQKHLSEEISVSDEPVPIRRSTESMPKTEAKTQSENESITKCPYHNNYNVIYFCISDNEFLCEECLAVHIGHDIENMYDEIK